MIKERWIAASAAYHFNNALSHPLYVDGDDRDDTLKDWFELRIYNILPETKRRTTFSVAVSCNTDLRNNLYNKEDKIREAIDAMECFRVYQLEADTDITLVPNFVPFVGVASLTATPIVDNLGEVREEAKIYQSDITGRYTIQENV